VKAPASQVLREVARDLHPNETFEKALGRIVRKHHGTFQDYITITGLVSATRGAAKAEEIGEATARLRRDAKRAEQAE